MGILIQQCSMEGYLSMEDVKEYPYSIGLKKKVFRNETEDQVKGLTVRDQLENGSQDRGQCKKRSDNGKSRGWSGSKSRSKINIKCYYCILREANVVEEILIC